MNRESTQRSKAQNGGGTQRDWVAVLGGASIYDEPQILAAYQTGQALARQGKNVLTGATTGIPYAAAMGARDAGALVVGISPAGNPVEHAKMFRKPLDQHDLIVYSGVGFEARGALIVRSAAACIFIGGEFGTLNEFTAAWMVGRKVLGVLIGSGGITDTLTTLMSRTKSTWGSEVIYDANPISLVAKVCTRIQTIVSPTPAVSIGRDVRAIVARFKKRGNTRQ